MNTKILSLRMERQHFINKADEDEYIELYRDTQPGRLVYFEVPYAPPTLVFRADFNDIEFNHWRRWGRKLLKGRFAGGNVGWIVPEDLELFMALYRKPIETPTATQLQILGIIAKYRSVEVLQIKRETGMLVKDIEPILQRLQKAFLVYEDMWDYSFGTWYKFNKVFPKADAAKYTKREALKIVLQRFAYRLVWFDTAMAKSFYELPAREIKPAIEELVAEGILVETESGYMLKCDAELLETYIPKKLNFVYAIHRSDFIYKAHEHILKGMAKRFTEGLEYDHKPLHYLLIDGEFHGVSVGRFRYGASHIVTDVICDLPDAEIRKKEIIDAVCAANYSKKIERFMGIKLMM